MGLPKLLALLVAGVKAGTLSTSRIWVALVGAETEGDRGAAAPDPIVVEETV